MLQSRLQTILPPYLMRRLGQAQDTAIRAAAQSTQLLDQRFRSSRSEKYRTALKPPAPTDSAIIQRALPPIQIYDAGHGQTLPGKLARGAHSGPVADEAVNEAWDGLGATLAFLEKEFRRDGLDGDGTRLRASVHFGEQYLNAFWDGRQMVFGDGDGILFRGFTKAVDVIGHELGHGIISDEGQLAYVYEPGALNESLADVFGSIVKQFHLGQAAHEADWLIGDQLLTSKVNGKGLRSLAAPGTAYDDPVLGKDPQPAHMRRFVRSLAQVKLLDHGSEHIGE